MVLRIGRRLRRETEQLGVTSHQATLLWLVKSRPGLSLRELALRMRVRVREADAIGRVAGDAFLAILPHTDEKGATVFAEAIRVRATQRPVSTGKGEVNVTVSIGVTTMRSRQDTTADTLLAWADEAVASARAGGGNVIAYDRLHGLARLDERRGSEDKDPGRSRGGHG